MERAVITFGETLLDIIFQNGKVVDAHPGGALLNSSVTLARLGVPVRFISETGDDPTGDMILKFLENTGVDTQLIYRYANINTGLALAFLDDRMEAHYSFYKQYPDKRMPEIPEVGVNGDYFLFGSSASREPALQDTLNRLITTFLNREGLIIYDPNFRSAHKHQLSETLPVIGKHLCTADIVRASTDDLKYILGTESPGEMGEKILASGVQALILTDGPGPVRLFTQNLNLTVQVEKGPVKSTIGAGDTFNAALVYSLLKLKVNRKNLVHLDRESWQELIGFAGRCALTVCRSTRNYLSDSEARELLTRLPFGK
ncbi:MAG: carbohydrate kinase [Bacteroidales bacterium]